MKWLLGTSLILLCLPARADVFVRDDIVLDPTPDRMSICHGNGCVLLSQVSLASGQWHQLRDVFLPLTNSAEEEREKLRRAIALMEQFVGAMTGTWRDKGGTFNGGEGQMDCIDESINTTLYLTMLQKFGLMRLHRVEDRATRGWFLAGWPHTTAVISEIAMNRENGTYRLWAVDSWFLDNGEPPFILPLETWKAGWEPIK
ncbi:MAG: hypothetical protein LC123_00880 [Burkholderiales bacterium]|jgi:hypothetical protein|nr:hypothetical protein [Rhodocyclaceae bacterium]MCZ2175685.1 hypothetical protein [Burkholderiales bacterium]GIK44557.1 MAG: hypothetical protein BroJett012_04600 [Betaproteobacteria bacterium]MCL4723273.1 hypothetical protein [Rhodocyclaceae bacterium]MCZ2418378.1 hypothetical protein [Burkholderiales bacterium]